MTCRVTLTMDNDSEHQLSQKLHDLRTPLNQIIGFSEMLMEIAEEEGRGDLSDGLGMVREAGVELTSLLQDKKFVATKPQPGREYLPLGDMVREAIHRVLGFTDSILDEAEGDRSGTYREDLGKIRSAACHFLDTAVSSGLLIRLETTRHWDNSPAAFRRPASSGPMKADGKVLIVDDENLNREILCRRLQREGYEARGAASGREALDILRGEPFDAILLDILMPEMSGIEVLQALKQDSQLRHLPVIMLSAITDIDRVVRCIELGAEDFLPKPTNSVLLRARLGACLEKSNFATRSRPIFRHCMRRRNG